MTLRMDLARGRLTMEQFAREARNAGMPAVEVAAALKKVAAAEAALNAGSGVGAAPSAPEEDTVMPAGTYYGRTHATAVKIVDGIFVPADAGSSPPVAAQPGSVEASLAWLREQGAWGCRAAERLGADFDSSNQCMAMHARGRSAPCMFMIHA